MKDRWREGTIGRFVEEIWNIIYLMMKKFPKQSKSVTEMHTSFATK